MPLLPRDLGPGWAWGNSRSGSPAQFGAMRAGVPLRSPVGVSVVGGFGGPQAQEGASLSCLDPFYGC